MNIFFRHFRRHRWFYVAVFMGAMAFVFSRGQSANLRFAIAADTFYLVYLILIGGLALRSPTARFRDWADDEDEGLFLIMIITLTTICFSIASIFLLLNSGRKPDGLLLLVSLMSAPLGWLVLHTSASLHYAHFYYSRLASEPAAAGSGGLRFPGDQEPGPWDFLYYSFVVGMTAQVADVQITSTSMRRLTLGHGIVSFIFNTVLLAMCVNVVVAVAQARS